MEDRILESEASESINNDVISLQGNNVLTGNLGVGVLAFNPSYAYVSNNKGGVDLIKLPGEELTVVDYSRKKTSSLKDNMTNDRELDDILNSISESQVRMEEKLKTLEYLDQKIDSVLEGLGN